MRVCTQCGKEDIPVIAPPEKCPHEYEIELQAADKLARAVKAKLNIVHQGNEYCCGYCTVAEEYEKHALAAYEKIRGVK